MSGSTSKTKNRECPECGTTFTFVSVEKMPTFPFCSDRCKSLDLGAWLSEDYQIVEEVSLLQPSLDDMPEEDYWA